jgi:hypothetical protein
MYVSENEEEKYWGRNGREHEYTTVICIVGSRSSHLGRIQLTFNTGNGERPAKWVKQTLCGAAWRKLPLN